MINDVLFLQISNFGEDHLRTGFWLGLFAVVLFVWGFFVCGWVLCLCGWLVSILLLAR